MTCTSPRFSLLVSAWFAGAALLAALAVLFFIARSESGLAEMVLWYSITPLLLAGFLGGIKNGKFAAPAQASIVTAALRGALVALLCTLCSGCGFIPFALFSTFVSRSNADYASLSDISSMLFFAIYSGFWALIITFWITLPLGAFAGIALCLLRRKYRKNLLQRGEILPVLESNGESY